MLLRACRHLASGFSVVSQQRVDEPEQLHHAFVLAEVLVSLEQEAVLLAVGAHD